MKLYPQAHPLDPKTSSRVNQSHRAFCCYLIWFNEELREKNNSSGSTWMHICVFFVSICVWHDHWIPCVVRLKPKLPGPVVDSHVSPTHCPRGSQDPDHCSGSVCSHTWNMGLDYTGLKYDSSQPEGVERGPLCCFAQMLTHTHTRWLHHRLRERTLVFRAPAKNRC